MTAKSSEPTKAAIVLNGEPRMVSALSMDGVLKTRRIPAGRGAVVLNGRVVRRAELAATAVADGDTIDMVTLAGGG